MTPYPGLPSRHELVAEWLRVRDARFWQRWEAMSQRHPGNPRKQLNAAFALLAKHFSDPEARGCAMANAAVAITAKDDPARRVIEAHKAKLRAKLAELCARSGAREPELLAVELLLLMAGALAPTPILGVQGPARDVVPAAATLIDSRLGAEPSSTFTNKGPAHETHLARSPQPHPAAENRQQAAAAGQAAEEGGAEEGAGQGSGMKPG